jgi:hypothetical protein
MKVMTTTLMVQNIVLNEGNYGNDDYDDAKARHSSKHAVRELGSSYGLSSLVPSIYGYEASFVARRRKYK